jgi:hypothetical protein
LFFEEEPALIERRYNYPLRRTEGPYQDSALFRRQLSF